MKKLFFTGAIALSVALFATNEADAQSKNLSTSLETLVTNTAKPEADLSQKPIIQTDTQARRGPSYWVQLFNVYLDVYLRYGYSANDAIDKAEQSVYREIEIYYGVNL
ncbi:hypothetical protein [Pedobacter punctiformis]|uniref:Uncharacterized protein n=1 Tax=Pedobacter punctiformis TaxID=3004097 RepID=A0ABT4L7C4_9SPHI|nr:hypothetical protein [Pedobacter sp. HCMS5-2]MCZ4243587.1 hypothetical protein [Pedobacter sp. HCMS5-2]